MSDVRMAALGLMADDDAVRPEYLAGDLAAKSLPVQVPEALLAWTKADAAIRRDFP